MDAILICILNAQIMANAVLELVPNLERHSSQRRQKMLFQAGRVGKDIFLCCTHNFA